MLNALESRGAHTLLEGRIVDEALHAVTQSFGVSDGDDETFYAIGKEIFRAGVG